MNAGLLPMALMAAAVGLVMAFAETRTGWMAVAALAATALAAAAMPLPSQWSGAVIAGLWISMAATAALAFLPRGLSRAAALAVGVKDGVWLGGYASVSTGLGEAAMVLPLSLLFIPAKWISRRGYAIVPKVLLSWMIAVASLSFLVSLTPTPGYVPDHME